MQSILIGARCKLLAKMRKNPDGWKVSTKEVAQNMALAAMQKVVPAYTRFTKESPSAGGSAIVQDKTDSFEFQIKGKGHKC